MHFYYNCRSILSSILVRDAVVLRRGSQGCQQGYDSKRGRHMSEMQWKKDRVGLQDGHLPIL